VAVPRGQIVTELDKFFIERVVFPCRKRRTTFTVNLTEYLARSL